MLAVLAKVTTWFKLLVVIQPLLPCLPDASNPLTLAALKCHC